MVVWARGWKSPISSRGRQIPLGMVSGERAMGFPAGFSCEGGSFFSLSLMTSTWVYLGVWVCVSAGSFSLINDISFYAVNGGDQGQDRNCFGHVVSVPFCGLGFFFWFFPSSQVSSVRM